MSYAVSNAVESPERGISCIEHENRSRMTRIVFLPSDSGRSVIKSRAKCDHGKRGVGSGMSLSAERVHGADGCLSTYEATSI